MRAMLHAIRDAEARLTGYGQCMRCHRSWRRAASVTVWWRPGTGTFLLCDRCFQIERLKADAGLILQGYAARHLDRPLVTYSENERRDILAAFGVAHHYPMEVSRTWGDWSYDVRVAELEFPVDSGAPGDEALYEPGYGQHDEPEPYTHTTDPEKPWRVGMIHQRCMQDHLPGECPMDAPGWDGAGAGVEAQRG